MIEWLRRWLGLDLVPVRPRPPEPTGLVRVLGNRPPVRVRDWRAEGWA